MDPPRPIRGRAPRRKRKEITPRDGSRFMMATVSCPESSHVGHRFMMEKDAVARYRFRMTATVS